MTHKKAGLRVTSQFVERELVRLHDISVTVQAVMRELVNFERQLRKSVIELEIAKDEVNSADILFADPVVATFGPMEGRGDGAGSRDEMYRGSLLTPAQVGQQLKISRTTLWKLRNEHSFPQPVRVGRRVLFRSTDLQEWLEARREEELIESS